MKNFEFTDREGDRLNLDFYEDQDPVLTIRERDRVSGVYLDRDDARALRDSISEFLGEGRPAGPETLDDARALLIQAGKDLIRKAAPIQGDLVVFMEPS